MDARGKLGLRAREKRLTGTHQDARQAWAIS